MPKRSILVNPDNLIFALDIGTRSVVGLVCHPENGKLRVLATDVAFHPHRDMLDGQIHNIEGVTKTARSVKESLEKRLGINLEKVSIAAAGRALKTCKYLAERTLEGDHRIRKEEIISLELEAVENAKEKLIRENLAPDGEKETYYCVGYTTVAYYLDGYPISSLAGQKGKKIGVEVLTTFLPQVVVESLLTVVEELGLGVQNLTLEPIAALNVAIPPEYRSLNLALVDIGAGTSDIAITHKGSVVGYAMVPLAGDEVTEEISEAFLLDFNTAEKIKLKLTQKKGQISFKDILGNSYNLPAKEILAVVEPVTEKIAAEIAATIKKYNNGPPRAVFCIGGGSQTPFLREKIADHLELPQDMVVIRGREIVHKIIYTGKKLKGPESITPFGIALSALQREYFGFSYVTVNNRVVRLLDTANLKVGNALIAAGYNPRKLLGRRGPSLKVFLDGKEKVIPGTPGESARILVNGQEASLETPVKNNDQIRVTEAKDGLPPRVKVKDLFPREYLTVYLNGLPQELPFRFLVNGRETEGDTLLQDGDKIEMEGICPLGTLVELNEIDPRVVRIKVNERAVPMDYNLKPGDRVTVEAMPEPRFKNKEDRKSDISPPEAD